MLNKAKIMNIKGKHRFHLDAGVLVCVSAKVSLFECIEAKGCLTRVAGTCGIKDGKWQDGY